MKPYPLILLLLLSFCARGQLKLTVTSTANSACGLNNGSITAVASDGVPPYEYSILGDPGFSTGNFTSLKPGDYVVATRDAAGTVVSLHVIIYNTTTPPLPTFTVKNPSACDKLDGVLTVNMAGGSPPFLYSLDDITYQSSNVFTNLTHGDYHVYVKDVNGCRRISSETVFLVAPDCGYTIRVLGYFPKCGSNGKLVVGDPLPGIPPRKYSLDGIHYQDSATFTNLAAGVYTIRIKDSLDAVRLFSVEIKYLCAMQLSLTTVGAGCNNNTGSITAVPVKGEGPYEFSLNDGPYQTSNRFDFLKGGTYTVKVRDVKGLVVSMSTTVAGACPVWVVTPKDATCGQPNGEIVVTASGGTLPYTYSIDGTSYGSSNRFAGLAAAKYTVYLKDAGGGRDTISAVVNGQPAPKVSGTVTPASCVNNDGGITAVSGNGQTPFVYSLLPGSFQSSPVFSNLAAGSYKLAVRDGNSCGDSVDVVIPLRNSLTLSLDPQVTICEGSTASLKVTSNAARFQWKAAPGITDATLRDQVVAPRVTTRYSVTATTGACTMQDSVLVMVNPAPQANAGKDQSVCYGEDARLEGSGGVLFSWTPAQYLTDPHSGNPVAAKPPATQEYSLMVTDAAGCSSLQPDVVKITVTMPTIFAGNDTSVLINQPFRLNAVDVNNTGFTQYTWQPQTGLSNGGIADPLATPEQTITYHVTARTASGCEASDNITVEVYRSADIYVPTAFTPNGDGHNDYARPILKGIRELTAFAIYNRWGGIVYRFTPGSPGWDGRLNGVPQNTATFTWIAAGMDYRGGKISRSGTITLLR